MFDHRQHSFFLKHVDQSRLEIDTAFNSLVRAEQQDPEYRFCWKVLRDRWYSTVATDLNSDQLIKAGFFDDQLDLETTQFFEQKLTTVGTPLTKIQKNLERLDPQKPVVVLVTTGAFAPTHAGHIHLMERAKVAAEAAGKQVAGGFISPGHQDYVRYKLHDEAQAFSLTTRLERAVEFVSDSKWLDVSLTEALFRPTSVNFTDILASIEQVCGAAYPDRQLEIWYVFGSDNSEFCSAFAKHGSAICVQRAGYEAEWLQKQAAHASYDRLLFTKADAPFSTYSSTQIRQQQPTRLNHTQASESLLRYLIRDDRSFILQNFSFKPDTRAAQGLDHVFEVVTSEIRKALKVDLNQKWEIDFIKVEDQQKILEQLEQQATVISLDSCTTAHHHLHMSRLFDAFTLHRAPKALVASPESVSLPQQLTAIKPGTYTLVDDDIATGFTTETMIRQLGSGYQITTTQSLSETKYPLDDVVDFRDFVIGAPKSGLVVEWKGEHLRVPYLWPYVNLVTRCSFPVEATFKFSAAIWEANAQFYEQVAPTRTLADLSHSSRQIYRDFGFSLTSTLVEICSRHAEFMNLIDR